MIAVETTNRSGAAVEEEHAADLARRVLAAEGVTDGELGIAFVPADEMRALKHKKDVDREVTLNQAFHFEIYRACGSAVLIPMIESLWLQSGPCIRVAIYAFSEAGEVDTAHYHRTIVKAISTQDAKEARDALVADISRPFTFLRSKLEAEAKKGLSA